MSQAPLSSGVDSRPRKRRSDGERSRNAILREAAQLATVEGIDGLSISRLAQAVGMSKSALFAEQVIEPAAAAPTALDRLRRLTENYLRHVEGAYPGGCFFAALTAEMDTHPGPVRDQA